MRDELLDFYGNMFMALKLAEVGLTFGEFLAGPVAAVLSARQSNGFGRWARTMSLSATTLAAATRPLVPVAGDPARAGRMRELGNAEHQRHDKLARRFSPAGASAR